MLTLRLTTCEDCTSISALLSDIDCKLTAMAKDQYNNVVFALNRQINNEVMVDLLHYKRILQNKACNADYASSYDVDEIAGRVRLLIFK